MSNIIIEQGAITNLKNYLLENYLGKRVVFLSNDGDIEKYRPFLKELKGLSLEMIVEEVAVDKCGDSIVEEVCQNVESMDYMVIFGAGDIIDIGKAVCTRLDIKYSIIVCKVVCEGIEWGYYRSYNEDMICCYNKCLSPDNIYVDIDMINISNRLDVANAFAGLLSYNYLLVEMLFMGCSKEEIYYLNSLLKGVNIFTSENIFTNKGKLKCLKLILDCEAYMSKLHLKNNLLEIGSIYKKFNKSNLRDNELDIVFGVIILKLLYEIFEGGMCGGEVNIEKRLDRVRTIFHNDKYITKIINNLSNLKNVYDTTENIAYYKDIINIALCRMVNNFSQLKRMYIDKGVLYNNINVSKCVNALSLASDILSYNSLNVLLSSGVFDMI